MQPDHISVSPPTPADTDQYAVIGHERDSEWLERRRLGLGASDVPAIMGVSSFGSPLSVQTDKWGLGEERDDSDPMQRWGHRLEPLILEVLGEEAGVAVSPFGFHLQSKAWPFMLCTPDGFAVGPDVEQETREDDWDFAFVQAKNSLRLDSWNIGDDGLLNPRRVWVQVQAEMAVTGHRWCYVAALCAGFDFRWAVIVRDDVFIDNEMIPTCEHFWKMTEAREQVPADFHEASRAALDRLYPEESADKAIALPASFVDHWETIASLSAARLDADKRIKGLQNEVRQAMGDAAIATLPNGGGFTWKTQDRKAYSVDASSSRVLRRSKIK